MEETSEPSAEREPTIDDRKPGSFALGFYLFAGVILPVAALVIEMVSRICAENLFDPLPTWWHVLLVAFVPVTNFQTWSALKKGESKRPGWLSFANGVAIFISLYYALVFLPVLPLAVIAIVFFLFGLLPLAPLFSLIAGSLMRWKMQPLPSASPWLQWKALGGALVFVVAVIGLSELNFTITRLGVTKTNSVDEATRNEGVAMLRKYGDTDYLLRLSYDGTGVVSPFMIASLLAGKPNSDQQTASLKTQAQKAFYQVTGKDYRQVPSPRGIRHWDRIEAWDDLDADGLFRVNNGLSLSLSELDGSVDGDAAVGYLEWTLVFKNGDSSMQEALSQIQLPPDAVVSRLTLWINGEEREAAFAKSAKVIEAYNTVTAKRRDPALVTVIGKDRIQLKCFPVPAHGEMKVRLGITIPVQLEDKANGFLPMPYFQDRNFVIANEHSIWVESKNALESASTSFRQERLADRSGIKGRITDGELSKNGSPIKVSRSPEIERVWAKDTINDGIIVKQELQEGSMLFANKLIFVIDTSAPMTDVQSEIAEAVRGISPQMKTEILLTSGNGLNTKTALSRIEGAPGELADMIAAAEFGGGTDAVPVLEHVMEYAEPPDTAIIWIHGPQTVELEPASRLTRLRERRGYLTPVFSVQVGVGRNVAERALVESDAVFTAVRFGNVEQDVKRLVEKLSVTNVSPEAVRTADTGKPTAQLSGTQTSQHLVRLWASDEVKRLLSAGDEEKAIDVAVKNQLVTRVSGAVVLETQEQYDQFGLKPVDPNSVPTIPEPEEYLLFAVVALVLIYFGWRFRRFRLSPV